VYSVPVSVIHPVLLSIKLETKLFVEDYASVVMFVLALIGIVTIPTIVVARRKMNGSKIIASS